jgi:Polyketide cyclase / dehydrase and lipid transport
VAPWSQISIISQLEAGLSEIGWAWVTLVVMLSPLHQLKGVLAMATAYYSTVFQPSAASVWKIIRDFNNYAVWVGGVGDSVIEDGKSGDTVGAVRSVHYQGRHIRQRLLALSDVERSQTYEFADTPTLPVTGFKATLGVQEIVDGNRAFVQWRADFDCEPQRREELCATLSLWFGQWLESLRKEMIRPGSPELAMAER